MNKVSLLVLLSLTFQTLFLYSCSNSTGPDNKNISLSAVKTLCTEAWVNLKIENISLPVNINIQLNGKMFMDVDFSTTTDTVIYIDSLLPQKAYTLQAFNNTGNGTVGTQSGKLSITTLDTTSSNFSYKLYALGNVVGESSTLYDVTIVNDTLAYAVGAVYVNDSTGQMYNLVKWNGHQWSLKRFPFNLYNYDCTIAGNYYGEAKTVYAPNDSEIIFSDGADFMKWNGRSYSHYPCVINLLNGKISKIWGTSSNDFYAVGTNGTIVHYRGGTWEKIQSGTSLDLFDIYSGDVKNIFASGGDFHDYSGILLKGGGNDFSILEEGENLGDLNQLFHPYFDGIAKTVWVSKNGVVYFGGNALYRYVGGRTDAIKSLVGNRGGENVNGKYFGFISQIRGLDDNTIIMVGEGNTIRYFNGIRWTQLGLPYSYSSDYTWLAVSIKEDMIIAAGHSSSKAIIMILKRY